MEAGSSGTHVLTVPAGTYIKRWRVQRLIGEGGFGSVFKVSDGTGEFAMKAECKGGRYQILKVEVYVLRELAKINTTHFVKIIDKGRHDTFNFVVMTLVGKNLEDLLKLRVDGCFSMGTAIGVGIKSLEALEDLHKVGYLHRDVKPSNYAIGRAGKPEDERTLYLLDFGICRRFLEKDGTVRRQRKAARGFRGTSLYASLNSHHLTDMSRKDDVESWVYMVVFITTGKLPWEEDIDDVAKVSKLKEGSHKEPGLSKLVEGCAPELKEIIKVNDEIDYYESPPYKRICELMRKSFKSTGTKEYPYDWEGILQPDEPLKAEPPPNLSKLKPFPFQQQPLPFQQKKFVFPPLKK